MTVLQIVRAVKKVTTARAALMAALVGLVAATCSPAVGLLSNRGQDADRGSERPVASAPATEPLTQGDMDGLVPQLPAPAPADGIPSAVVQNDAPASPPPVAAGPAQPVEFKPVKVQMPRIRVSGVTAPRQIRAIRGLQGVRHATSIEVARLPVGAQQSVVTVAAVDPKEFRKLTPQVTADSVAVWQRIVEGDAAFTHDTGNRLKAELGSFVPAGSEGHTLRVGAYASNGVPPVADAIVSPQTADLLGLQGTHDVLVSLRRGVDPEAIARDIARVSGARVEVLEEPQTRRAFLTGADARNKFEPFTYIDNGDGMIQIDPDWVRRNIVRRAMPLLKGEVVCHRMMVDQLYGALKEIDDRELDHLIDPSQYGGCWVPRHIDFNPAKPISMHGWGLAADFNVSTNGLGQRPQMDPRIVEIFDRWGFVWGGRWSRPDGMHFELGALLHSPQG